MPSSNIFPEPHLPYHGDSFYSSTAEASYNPCSYLSDAKYMRISIPSSRNNVDNVRKSYLPSKSNIIRLFHDLGKRAVNDVDNATLGIRSRAAQDSTVFGNRRKGHLREMHFVALDNRDYRLRRSPQSPQGESRDHTGNDDVAAHRGTTDQLEEQRALCKKLIILQ